ncbi:MAG: type III-A CRISPR-associated RAMP protein Csm3 [Hapalosiphonaceae cyanobacterium JJU2]|nr:MAG: type III-A CRISPR-associated RAMP protein Csm3 [Hapalosiphonaceae cyanobacterium JJU2]
MLQQKQLLGKFRLEAILVSETGLHIGGGGGNLDIGGLDKPVARDPMTQFPYLPGSSIKGKLRAILERYYKKPLNRRGSRDTFRYESDDLVDGYTEIYGQKIPYEAARTCPISRLFGSTGGGDFWVKTIDAIEEKLERAKRNDKFITEIFPDGVEYSQILRGRNSPARLIVRDCHLVSDSAEKLKRVDTGLYMTEWKWENGLDRVTAAANPRQIERVPAGAEFNFQLVYTVEADSNQTGNLTQEEFQAAIAQAVNDLRNIAIALSLLEDDALGGHGSRGYGKVRFKNYRCFWRDVEQYRRVTEDGVEFKQPIITVENTDDDTLNLLKQFGNLSDEMQKSLPGGS